jgi:hypothetical protein
MSCPATDDVSLPPVSRPRVTMLRMAKPAHIRRRIIGAVLHIIGQDGMAAVTNRRIAKEGLRSLATGSPAEDLVDALLLLTGPAQTGPQE